MADFEVHIDLGGRTRQIGLARSNRVRGREIVTFEYDSTWLEDPDRFQQFSFWHFDAWRD